MPERKNLDNSGSCSEDLVCGPGLVCILGKGNNHKSTSPYHFPMVIHCLQIPSVSSLQTAQRCRVVLLGFDWSDAEITGHPPLVILWHLVAA